MLAARADLERLLRAKKLDVTLTTHADPASPDEALAPTGWAALDDQLGGGLRRGHLSEVIGARSAGRTSAACAMAAAAIGRGEVVALVDTHGRFDPASAAAAGVDLRRLLWVRDTGQAARALKAVTLVLQAGGFGLVIFDIADVPGPALRQFPHTTWMRLARIVEGGQTVALLVASEHVARSAGGATIVLERDAAAAPEWAGDSARARRLARLAVRPRVIAARAPQAPHTRASVASSVASAPSVLGSWTLGVGR